MFLQITLVGNLGRDPEMRYAPSGTPVTNMNVATNRSFKNAAGDTVKETIWVRVSAWGKMAESCNQFLHKGSKVLVQGRLLADKDGNPRVWTGTDGSPRSSFEVNAETIRFLSSNGNGEHAENGEAPANGAETAEEIPF
jgi:single-strand DNA-binding protein